MPKDVATLLAQIIPVFGLALGIELRSAAVRLRGREPGRSMDDTVPFSFLLVSAGVLASLVLSSGELIAIAAATGAEGYENYEYGTFHTRLIPGSYPMSAMLEIAITLAFMLPAWDLLDAVFVQNKHRKVISGVAGVALVSIPGFLAFAL